MAKRSRLSKTDIQLTKKCIRRSVSEALDECFSKLKKPRDESILDCLRRSFEDTIDNCMQIYPEEEE